MRAIFAAALLMVGVGCAAAQAPKADCSKWKRGTDGRWMSTIDAKIGNPKEFKLLKPGIPIDRDEMIVGLNVSDMLDQLCGRAAQ